MSGASLWLRRRSRVALVAGLLGSAALALTTAASLGGFTASITNTGDAAGSGSLVMQEQVGSPATTCLSTGTGTVGSTTVNTTNANTTCPANKFGTLTNAEPGNSNSTNVIISNVGSVIASTLTMNVGACTAAANTATTTYSGSDTAGFCSKIDVTIEDDTVTATPRCVYPAGAGACPALATTYNLTTLATGYTTAASILPTATTVAAGAARTYKFTVGIDTSATNADQGLNATEPITFTFAQ